MFLLDQNHLCIQPPQFKTTIHQYDGRVEDVLRPTISYIGIEIVPVDQRKNFYQILKKKTFFLVHTIFEHDNDAKMAKVFETLCPYDRSHNKWMRV